MEDAATAEISRAQVWQWRHHGVELTSGERVTTELVRRLIGEEMERVRAEVGEARFAGGKFREATELFERLSVADQFEDFLTVPAYRQLVQA